jgi:hypothetical protein
MDTQPTISIKCDGDNISVSKSNHGDKIFIIQGADTLLMTHAEAVKLTEVILNTIHADD